MNNPHHGARLTVHSRERIVARVLGGQRASEVAAAFAASLRTVRKRALRWFRAQGIRAERAMTDHGSADRSRRFAKALRLLTIRHILTRPYTPKTDGKAEKFIQTRLRDRACGLAHPSSNARNADLPRWLDWFNQARPHPALNGLSPASTVNKRMRPHS